MSKRTGNEISVPRIKGEVTHAKGLFEVQLDILPSMEFEALNEYDAVQQYFKQFGIIQTENSINVKRLDKAI